ncbi:tannase and feruloyl esterase [Pterulicium gracile]|uniref:Carboxylic ester hydrolase n=1 Tax=Pterulicium gracile TaxID=1884261 RepID=A0A5C3QCU2_9AGAR|nr:tannase and feruloyl esterase [Pterula gracilis]
MPGIPSDSLRLLPCLKLIPFALAAAQQSFAAGSDRCLGIADLGPFKDTTIISATRVAGNSSVQPWGVCGTDPVPASVPLCRVQFSVKTSNVSEVKAEAWLPDEWHGRFLAIGNGGLGGCIDYTTLNYGSSFHFASFASNNGHDGDQGQSFYQQPEVLEDFAARSIHALSVAGKKIVRAYYSKSHTKSYYIGCSQGGRQGTYSALHWPKDFDGILAGAPGTNWHFLIGSLGLLSRYTGAPEGVTYPSFIPRNLWGVIKAEILKQCDSVDGVKNGIVDYSDACRFRPEVLSCSKGGEEGISCLTEPQLEAVRKVYSALLGQDGEQLYPGYSLGADPLTVFEGLFGGFLFPYANDWWKYGIYQDPDYDLSNFSLDDILAGNEIDSFQISTFSGDFTDFHARGGKFLTYIGTHDQLIPTGNAVSAYDLALEAMGKRAMDHFYRLFVVPGMDHCGTPLSPGPFRIGHNFPLPPKNDTNHNVLLALVDWVEGGKAPETILGTSSAGEERILCKHPLRSVWNGKKYVCKTY